MRPSARGRVRLGVSARATAASTVRVARKPQGAARELKEAEAAVLAALSGAKGRGKEGLSPEDLSSLEAAVAKLEADGGVVEPTLSPTLDGRWRLLYTSRPGSASPIQRTFTGVESFGIFQDVELRAEAAEGEEGGPRVNNVVEFGAVGYLKVEAQASTQSNPLPGFTPREGEGLPFGIMGRSFTYPPARPHSRVDFQFDRAAFYFRSLPFTLPYPVPFRLLGDERKGWIDVTYMNAEGTFRLTRGNKGTLFILQKEIPLKQRLMDAIAEGNDEEVASLVSLLEQDNPTPAPARSPLAAGTWRLVWSQQAAGAGALQKWGTKQAESYQVIEASGAAANIVKLGSLGELRAPAETSPASDTRTNVSITGAGLFLGPVRLPLPAGPPKGTGPGYIDWLYLDEEMRISRGNKGSLFIHRRV
ncbi:hypothetical protein HYH03_002335 [Edaphochlamys debaryana]|uniref:Plastid lipid-associated protein/fibrillin conserved domain-containing protein n=1 Tax=Edaphochlamys debaryana TaxID=47281 RepID=A0A835YCB0_9CHLO|nr:hypothetical protein HYH03_002335 [Edaphochlamys debaryana]|eukprot:KAG2500058.1 hypothetical protein HYH03_002335 [Edaphochlamys debaryana]